MCDCLLYTQKTDGDPVLLVIHLQLFLSTES